MNQGIKISLGGAGWEACGHSITCYEKERNGDHLLLEDIKDEKILVAVVADGITNRPCDWLASELACKRFFEFFIKSDSLPIMERIKEGIKHANNNLLSVEDKCRGLASTLVLAVWEYEREEFCFANLGDSRLYWISNNGSILQITRDDSVITKRNVHTSLGIRNISTLANHMRREFPDIQVYEKNLSKGDLLLLASDGFYNARRSSFEKNLTDLNLSVNLRQDFENLVNKYEISASDDMSAIIIRKNV